MHAQLRWKGYIGKLYLTSLTLTSPNLPWQLNTRTSYTMLMRPNGGDQLPTVAFWTAVAQFNLVVRLCTWFWPSCGVESVWPCIQFCFGFCRHTLVSLTRSSLHMHCQSLFDRLNHGSHMCCSGADR